MKCIGLFGGLGVGAAIHYYDALARGSEARGSGLELTMVHAQMSRVFEHAQADDRPGLATYLAGIIDRLKASGAELTVIPAVTPHLCIAELEAISSLPIVNLLTAARAAIKGRGLRRVALFGTRFVIQTGMCGALHDIELVALRPDDVDLVHTTYTQLARSGRASDEQHRSLTRLAQTLCAREGAEAIVLAGTDLTLLFNASNTDFPHVDCAAAHIEAVTRAAQVPDAVPWVSKVVSCTAQQRTANSETSEHANSEQRTAISAVEFSANGRQLRCLRARQASRGHPAE